MPLFSIHHCGVLTIKATAISLLHWLPSITITPLLVPQKCRIITGVVSHSVTGSVVSIGIYKFADFAKDRVKDGVMKTAVLTKVRNELLASCYLVARKKLGFLKNLRWKWVIKAFLWKCCMSVRGSLDPSNNIANNFSFVRIVPCRTGRRHEIIRRFLPLEHTHTVAAALIQ